VTALDAPPDRRVVRRIVVAAVVLLVVFSVAFVVVREIARADDIAWRLSWGWLGLAALGFAALHLWHAELWHRLLGHLGAPVDARTAWSTWMLSTPARYVPTSLLMPVVRVAMLRTAGVARRTSLSGVVHELALAFVAALIISSFFLVTLPALSDQPLRWGLLAIPVLAVAALNHRIFDPLANRALRRLGHDPKATAVTVDTTHSVTILVGYLASFVLGGLALFALVRGIQPVPFDDLPTVVVSFAVGYNASVAAPILGGIGSREAGLTAALATVMTGSAALAVAIASRIVMLVVELAFSGVAARERIGDKPTERPAR
jgi:uncharacterized membrane protein YbhN (UPF0104 family)